MNAYLSIVNVPKWHTWQYRGSVCHNDTLASDTVSHWILLLDISSKATDFESDSGIFHIFWNHGENRTKTGQATFCTFPSIAKDSVYYRMFWCRDGTNLAQSEKGSDL